MKHWTGRIIILVLLVAIVGLPLLLRPRTTAAPDDRKLALVIYSPHNEQIRFEVGEAYNRHRIARGLDPVYFDWRSSGGTGDLVKQVNSEMVNKAKEVFEALDKLRAFLVKNSVDQAEADKLIAEVEKQSAEMTDDEWREFVAKRCEPLPDGAATFFKAVRDAGRANADLFFGGGPFPHDGMTRGIDVEYNSQQRKFHFVQRPVIPEEAFAEAFPVQTIGGEDLYRPDRLWVGVVLSSFGIIFNRDVLDDLAIDDPVMWEDLADPRYAGWIGVADPMKSGSVNAAYLTILQRYGWERGWWVMRRMFANAAYFTGGASTVPVDVSKGESAAGVCIGFYGRYQSGFVPNDRMGYVDPPGMTAITADPITLLRNAPNRELANQFITWLISKEGQRIWQLRKLGSETAEQAAARRAAGIEDRQLPRKFELRRMPIRRDMYPPVGAEPTGPQEWDHWVDRGLHIWALARPMPDGAPNWWDVIPVVAHAMAIDNHDDLKAAWAAINREPDPATKAKMLERFDAMPPQLIVPWPDADMAEHWLTYLEDVQHPRHDETKALLKQFRKSITGPWDHVSDLKEDDRRAWSAFFRENYRTIIAMQSE